MIVVRGNYVIAETTDANGRTYHSPLCHITDAERSLCAGRFRKFTHQPQPYVVRIEIRSGPQIKIANLNFESVMHLTTCIVTWIAEHGDEFRWTVDHLALLDRDVITFGFDSPNIAVLLRLLWS